MKSSTLMSLSFAVGALALPGTEAAVIALNDFAFNVNGVVTAGAFPAGVNGAAFNTAMGLGSVRVTVSGAGPHYVAMFVDHEIDEAINTYFNESAFFNFGPFAAGLTWELDEPGWVNGDIYENFSAGALDRFVGGSIYGVTSFPDDVSMAMAYDFVLGAGESAEVMFTLGLVMPPPLDCYLWHFDTDSNADIYFTSTLTIIPEPGLAWLPLACAGLFSVCSRRRSI